MIHFGISSIRSSTRLVVVRLLKRMTLLVMPSLKTDIVLSFGLKILSPSRDMILVQQSFTRITSQPLHWLKRVNQLIIERDMRVSDSS
jgi:hypothetical protein